MRGWLRVREGGGGQEARRGGQEQLRAKVRQDHLSPWGPGVSERLGKIVTRGRRGAIGPSLVVVPEPD